MKTLSGLLGMVFLQACATSTVLPPPPSEALRGRMVIVRVENLSPVPKIQLDTPVRGWLAGIPAGACDVTAALFGAGGDPGFFIFFAPVGPVIGAVYGPIVALPPEEVDRGEKLLRGILERASSGFETRVEDELKRRALLRATRGGEEVVLSVGIDTVNMTGQFWLNPFLKPDLKVRCRLIRLLDRTVLYETEVHHSTSGRGFTTWVASSEDLQRYFERALQETSEKVLDEVFLTFLPPKP